MVYGWIFNGKVIQLEGVYVKPGVKAVFHKNCGLVMLVWYTISIPGWWQSEKLRLLVQPKFVAQYVAIGLPFTFTIWLWTQYSTWNYSKSIALFSLSSSSQNQLALVISFLPKTIGHIIIFLPKTAINWGSMNPQWSPKKLVTTRVMEELGPKTLVL